MEFEHDEPAFEPSTTVKIEVRGSDPMWIPAEDYGEYAVAMFDDLFGVVSKELGQGLCAFRSLKVARNFAQQFPLDYPDFIHAMKRFYAGKMRQGDREYVMEAEMRKHHVSYVVPGGVTDATEGKLR